MRRLGLAIGLLSLAHTATAVYAAGPQQCPKSIDVKADSPFGTADLPPAQSCSIRMSNGFPIPDPSCTPGATNHTVTLKTLLDPKFRTACLRDKGSSAAAKATTYEWYKIKHPTKNTGLTMTCELDHLVSLELGGADTLDNIWPQCGPPRKALAARFFKQKDTVENYLAMLVRDGKMDLAKAQEGIATDWTQFLEDAKKACDAGKCK